MSRAWNSRVVEEANLFNPAFCATLLAAAAKDFSKKTAGAPLPFALAFLVLPVVLHEQTRAALPHSTITSLLPWLQDNRAILVGFSQRVLGVRPVTQEALIFGIGQGALALNGPGVSVTKTYKAPTETRAAMFTEEAFDCVDAATFLGRWFASAGTTSTIFAAWGVAP